MSVGVWVADGVKVVVGMSVGVSVGEGVSGEVGGTSVGLFVGVGVEVFIVSTVELTALWQAAKKIRGMNTKTKSELAFFILHLVKQN